jgi:hypothetical protein
MAMISASAALQCPPFSDARQARLDRVAERFEIPMLVAALLVIPAMVNRAVRRRRRLTDGGYGA